MLISPSSPAVLSADLLQAARDNIDTLADLDDELRVFGIKAAKSGSAMRGCGNALSLVPEPDLDITSGFGSSGGWLRSGTQPL